MAAGSESLAASVKKKSATGAPNMPPKSIQDIFKQGEHDRGILREGRQTGISRRAAILAIHYRTPITNSTTTAYMGFSLSLNTLPH